MSRDITTVNLSAGWAVNLCVDDRGAIMPEFYLFGARFHDYAPHMDLCPYMTGAWRWLRNWGGVLAAVEDRYAMDYIEEHAVNIGREMHL